MVLENLAMWHPDDGKFWIPDSAVLQGHLQMCKTCFWYDRVLSIIGVITLQLIFYFTKI